MLPEHVYYSEKTHWGSGLSGGGFEIPYKYIDDIFCIETSVIYKRRLQNGELYDSPATFHWRKVTGYDSYENMKQYKWNSRNEFDTELTKRLNHIQNWKEKLDRYYEEENQKHPRKYYVYEKEETMFERIKAIMKWRKG